MVKKLKVKSEELTMTENVLDFARLIWLAGLGAFAKVEEEGGKLFENLVKEGEKVENRTRELADARVEDVRDRVEEMKSKALDTWEKLEETLEDRVTGILNRLGVPTSKDIEDLSRRVEELNESVRQLMTTKGG